MIRIIPLRAGWNPVGADDPDYPQDLPADWRLTYFANEHPAVLVPADLWQAPGQATDEAVSGWVRDTPARFRFYLEIGADADLHLLARVCAALGPSAAGLVGEGGALARCPCRLDLPRFAWVAGADQRPLGAESLAAVVPESVGHNARAARDWVDRWQTQPGGDLTLIAALGPCEFAQLRRWETLVALMGLG